TATELGVVASAGDVNGDGYGDVLVASPFFHGPLSTTQGRVWLYLGSPSGLSSTAAWVRDGDFPSMYFGGSMSSAGDIDGDGYGDVLVSAYNYSNEESHEGEVVVFLGSPSGLSTSPSSRVEGDSTSASLGLSLSGAGDMNGDGYSDVVAGKVSNSIFSGEARL